MFLSVFYYLENIALYYHVSGSQLPFICLEVHSHFCRGGMHSSNIQEFWLNFLISEFAKKYPDFWNVLNFSGVSKFW